MICIARKLYALALCLLFVLLLFFNRRTTMTMSGLKNWIQNWHWTILIMAVLQTYQVLAVGCVSVRFTVWLACVEVSFRAFFVYNSELYVLTTKMLIFLRQPIQKLPSMCSRRKWISCFGCTKFRRTFADFVK